MSFLPIIISLFNSFKNDFEIMTNVFAPPTEFDFWGFAKAWSDISKNLWNGVFVALVAGIFNTVLGSLIAYIFQQKQFIGKEFLYKFYIFIRFLYVYRNTSYTECLYSFGVTPYFFLNAWIK